MTRYVLLMVFCLPFLSLSLCEVLETATYSPDDFKCSLPDVTSIDRNLDITRFRSDFSKISEVKFPGLIGPLNERLICKIKCIDGNWVGPLCSITPDGRFQPILRECLYRHDHPLLAISFKNSSIVKNTHFPHGSEIAARCRHFGMYKLKGEARLRCENGEWAPDFPECVPTTLLTNFTGDAPPTIQYSITSGSGVVGPFGELFLYPDSTLRLGCVTPRALGDPDWSWHAPGRHSAGWSLEEGEQESVYRLALSKLPARHSDQLTCTAPGGHTHTVLVKVVNVTCLPIETGSSPVAVFSQGLRLGQTQHFTCPTGYHLEGESVLTCMPDGRWSGPAGRCAATRCPALEALDPQLSVVELNASWGGRAVFRCAWGYRLAGAPGLECERDGAWSAAPPRCTRMYTGPAQLSVVELNASWGGRAVFRCAWGYRLAGAPGLECERDGAWSAAPPRCTRMYTGPAQLSVVELNASWGGRAVFRCAWGYRLAGAPGLECERDGAWSAAPPRCTRMYSGPAQLSVVELNASWGGRAVFRCAWGYRLAGAPGLECERDGAWSAAPPRCTPIYCPDPLVPENGRLVTEPSSKHGMYVVGDLMIYSCAEGFQILGEPSIVCTENGFWSHPPPFCLPPSEIRKPDTIYVENTTLVHVEE